MSEGSNPSEFASLVKGYLYDRNLTQVWLAEAVKIAPASLSRVMRGKRNPSAKLVLAITEVLGLPSEEGQQLLAAAGYGRTAISPTSTGGGSQSTPAVRLPLLARGGFNFPHMEDEKLFDEIRQLLQTSGLSPEQRAEVRRLISSFVAWLLFTYQGNGQ